MLEGQATFALSHRAIYPTDDAILWVERHFFVGRFYNSLQMLGYAIPDGDGTIIFFVNRTSTENVSGFGGAARARCRPQHGAARHGGDLRAAAGDGGALAIGGRSPGSPRTREGATSG